MFEAGTPQWGISFSLVFTVPILAFRVCVQTEHALAAAGGLVPDLRSLHVEEGEFLSPHCLDLPDGSVEGVQCEHGRHPAIAVAATIQCNQNNVPGPFILVWLQRWNVYPFAASPISAFRAPTFRAWPGRLHGNGILPGVPA